MKYIFTSAAANYLPKVAILYNSVKKYHPDVRFVLACVERSGTVCNVVGNYCDELVTVDDLDVGGDHRWLFGHTIVELSTAIKPFVLKSLLDRSDCDSVTYIDPDIALFDRIDTVWEFDKEENIVLTPHLCHPEKTERGIEDHEISCLRHGIFNLGFLSVKSSDEGIRLARWWANRCYLHCTTDWSKGLFTDQRWMDFAPVFFEGVRIEKGAHFNLAPWNVGQRNIGSDAHGNITVDGVRLGFYHFTGWDRGAHVQVLNHYLDKKSPLWELIEGYDAELKINENKASGSTEWSLGQFENGEPITGTHRYLFGARPDLYEVFSNPFSSDEQASKAGNFQTWFSHNSRIEHPELFEDGAGDQPEEGSPNRTLGFGNGKLTVLKNRIIDKLKSI